MRESRGSTKPRGAMKVKAASRRCGHSVGSPSLLAGSGAHHRPVSSALVGEAEPERTRWDPKDGELCLSRTKPEETLVEVRSDSDVQIDRQTWV